MITLTQTFESSDEIEEHFVTIEQQRKASKILWELNQWLRSEIKYGNKVELEPAREKLYELSSEENFDWN